jgi:hypothetical protein
MREDFFMAAVLRLTKVHENVLRKAYEREDKKVLGGSPVARNTLSAFGYLKHIGMINGYDQHELTHFGCEAAKPIFETWQANNERLNRFSKEKTASRIKAALFDDLLEALTNSDIGAKTFELPSGWKLKLDRSGPNKVIVQVTRRG